MVPRPTDEPHRVSTPLELLFDLCFVVAVAQDSAKLHHALAADDVGSGIVAYLTVFFAVWWAWMNFTWFASAYDVDDVPYRVAVLVQITGVLILAAGVPRAFDGDFAVVTLGYAVMRCGLVAQWLRAARGHPSGRRTALIYTAGVSVCMIGWAALLAVPGSWRLLGFAVMALAELTVPVLAELSGQTPWHPHHIAERYSLFTIIVLGESILSATMAVQTSLDEREAGGSLYAVAAGGLLCVFALWWLYFARPAHGFLTSIRVGFVWGYGHFVVFAAAAALGAGLAVNIDHATGHSHLGGTAAGGTVTVPVAVYLVAVWLLHLRPHHTGTLRTALLPIAALVVVAATFSGAPVPVTGLVLVGLIGCVEFAPARRSDREPTAHQPADE